MLNRWNYSLALLVGYLGVFQLWIGAERSFVVASGILWCLAFGVWLMAQSRRRYFLGRLDGFGHGVVVLDVGLEAILLKEHDHVGFWLCGFGFAVVIGGYRWWVMGRQQ